MAQSRVSSKQALPFRLSASTRQSKSLLSLSQKTPLAFTSQAMALKIQSKKLASKGISSTTRGIVSSSKLTQAWPTASRKSSCAVCSSLQAVHSSSSLSPAVTQSSQETFSIMLVLNTSSACSKARKSWTRQPSPSRKLSISSYSARK